MAKKGRRPPPHSGGTPQGGGAPRGGRGAKAGVPDMQQLMQQAAEMQAQMQQQQEALAEQTFEGTAGGGVVTVVVTGTGELVSVDIDPSVLDPDDPELVGDLVVAAVNQATEAMRDAAVSAVGLPGVGDVDLGSLDLDDLGGLLG
jgi:DNA-binding YbaB/EbfC family protein